jgi:thiamine pyrophosphate-dependent acetolactate synthase large subunit-like protein
MSAPAHTSTGVACIRLLEAYGVDLVFGIPGVHTLELYRGLQNSRIRHITPRHEQGAGFMADGYARVSGRPGVCLLTTGPGLTNAATPIAQAFSDSQPMLAISSVNARADLGAGRGRLHEITNQQAAMAPLTAFSQTILDPAELPDAIGRAFAVFSGARPRPVHIEIPLDVLDMPGEFPIRARPAVGHPPPAPEAIAAAADLIRHARNPFLIIGGGANRAGAPMLRLVELIGGPVAPTKAGKGTIPDTHPLSLGANLISKAAQELLARADVVVVIGSELAETDHYAGYLPIEGRVIRIDVDIQHFNRDYPADVPILADAGRAVNALLTLLEADPPPERGAAAAAAVAAARARILEKLPPLRRKHRKVLDALRHAMPHDGVVFSDMTQIAYAGNQLYPCSEPRTWFHPNGYGTLGFGLPAAIGAKLARPEAHVAALVGDGGLLFTVQELATAVELEMPLAVVMWNNDGYGQIRDGLVQRGVAEIGVNLRNPDHLMLARAFGCNAMRPDGLDAFKDAVAGAARAKAPTFIEVREDAAFLA